MGLSFRGMTLVERLFATSFNTLQRFAFVRRGRSWVPSPLAGEGQGEGKSSGNESTHPNEKCCSLLKGGRRWRQGLQREKYTIFEVAEHAELKQALVTLKPAVLLLDFSLLGLKGVKGVSAIYQLSPQGKILVFTDTLDDAEGL